MWARLFVTLLIALAGTAFAAIEVEAQEGEECNCVVCTWDSFTSTHWCDLPEPEDDGGICDCTHGNALPGHCDRDDGLDSHPISCGTYELEEEQQLLTLAKSGRMGDILSIAESTPAVRVNVDRWAVQLFCGENLMVHIPIKDLDSVDR